MPANMKKAGIKYKKGGSKRMKKASRGTGNLPRANRGQAIGNWIDRAIDNVGGFAGNVWRDVTDPIVGAADWFGDADRSWVGGTEDAWNIRPDDYKYSGRGWNKPGWKAGDPSQRRSSKTPPPAPVDNSRGKSARNRKKWADQEEYVPQSQRRSRGGVVKKYSDGGHVVPGKFLRQGPTRR